MSGDRDIVCGVDAQDSDVEEEAERVRTGQVDCNSAVIIQNLVKVSPHTSMSDILQWDEHHLMKRCMNNSG